MIELKNNSEIELKATTFFGLEEVLAKELLKLGAKDIKPFKRGVAFVGDLGFLYKANLCLRTALKVLVPIAKFQATTDQELYTQIKQISWEDLMSVDDTLAVDAVINSDYFNHSLYIALKTKDAIVDRFREKMGKRPDVDIQHPTLRIYVHIFKNEVTVGLDSSGDLLYKRGYRDDTNKAPMNEALAAGLIMLSDWQPHQLLIDGMTGSGTLAIEAGLYANNVPPGYFRREFGFMKWRNFDEALYETIYDGVLSKIKENTSSIIANDNSKITLSKAKQNITNAKLDDVITLSNQSFFDLTTERKSGVIILNPPYGERMAIDEITSFYKEIGNKLKKDFSGFTAWIISSNIDATHAVGLRATRRIALFNGSLECKFLKYELYSGSKKQPPPTDS